MLRRASRNSLLGMLRVNGWVWGGSLRMDEIGGEGTNLDIGSEGNNG